MQIRFVSSKCDKKKGGVHKLGVHNYACTVVEREGNRAGGFEVVLELLSVHSQLPGGAPLTTWAASRGGIFC